jgi:hypothetical protein
MACAEHGASARIEDRHANGHWSPPAWIARLYCALHALCRVTTDKSQAYSRTESATLGRILRILLRSPIVLLVGLASPLPLTELRTSDVACPMEIMDLPRRRVVLA